MNEIDLDQVKQELETLREAVRDYLKHPSLDGAPVRQAKRRRLAGLVAITPKQEGE